MQSSYRRNNGGGLCRRVKRKEKECKQMSCKMVITPGEDVEVSSNEEGLKDAWFKATILRARKGKSTALVRYHTLLDDDSETNLLEESVNYRFIRPLPPLDGDQKPFQEQEIVDAYDNDGWWKGTVAKVRVLGDNSRIYTVLFKNVNPPEEIEYLPSCLRLHMDWVDGQWVRPPKPQRMEGLTFSRARGMAVEVNIDKGDREYGVLGETIEDETSSQHSEKSPSQQSNNCPTKYKRKKAKQCKPDSWPMLHLPKKAKRKSNTKSVPMERLVNNDTCYDIRPLNVPELNSHGEGVSTKSQEGDKQQQKSEDKTTRGGASGLNFEDGASGQNFEDSASEDVQFPTMKAVEPKGDENNAGNGGRRMEDCTSKQNDAVMGAGGGTVDCTSKEVELPTAIGTECEHIGIECGFNKMDSKGCMAMDIELPTTTIVDLIGDGAKEMDYEESATEDVESPKKMQVEHVGKENNNAMDFESCAVELVGVSKSIRVEHMGSEPIVSRCSTSKMQFIDCGGTKEDELPVKTSLESAGKDHCRSSGDDTELAEGTGTGAGNNICAGEELIMEQPEIPETTTFVKYQMLPFVKESSSVWEVVESLQVFRALPQRPHFRPLTECKESVREGLAIGHMVTFSQLAEKIQKLRACDSQEIFDCHLDSLAELEKHGFDTTSLVHRLNKLLSVKDKREKLGHQFKKVQTQIVERSQCQAKLENDIDNMNKKLRELQKEHKEKWEELTAMKSEAFFTEEQISNADEEFENIATAGW